MGVNGCNRLAHVTTKVGMNQTLSCHRKIHVKTFAWMTRHARAAHVCARYDITPGDLVPTGIF